MAARFGRRGTEAPMEFEFTNRSSPAPAWRFDADEQNGPVKRTHSFANPPPSPFDPKKMLDTSSRPVFGENLRYLFKPPELSSHTPSPFASSSSPWSTPTRQSSAPEVDMKDVEITPPPPPPPAARWGQSLNRDEEKENAEVNGETQDDEIIDSPSPVRRVISNAAVRRRARREVARVRTTRFSKTKGHEVDVNSDDDDDEDIDPSRVPVTRNTSNHFTLNMPGPIAAKSDTPYVLLGYTQFLFNLSLVLVFLYLLLQFIFTVQHDVEQRIGEHSMEILQEITTCASLYKQNLCDTSPIPAMLHQCASWETCMNRDPKIVGRAKVGAEMLAEVVNGFIEPISWKTLAFTLSSLAFLTVFVNTVLSLYRSRQHTSQENIAHNSAVPPIHAIPAIPPFRQMPYAYLSNGSRGANWPAQWQEDISTDSLPKQRRRLENGEAVAVGKDGL